MKAVIAITLLYCVHSSTVFLENNSTSASLKADNESETLLLGADLTADSSSGKMLLSGYLQATDTEEFLACDLKDCWFEENSDDAVQFKREVGADGQYQFVVIEGDYAGMCLNREHFYRSSSNTRLADCNDHGSGHWSLTTDGQLCEDLCQNCMQNNAELMNCDEAYQTFAFYEPLKEWNPPVGHWQLIATSVNGSIMQNVAWGISSADT